MTTRVLFPSLAIAALAASVLAHPAFAEEPAANPAPPALPTTDPSALPALPAPATKSTDPLPDLVAPAPTAKPEPLAAPPPAEVSKAPDEQKDESTRRHNPVFRASAGYDWRSYYGVPFRGVDFGLGLGGELGHFAAYGELGLTLSDSSANLGSRRVRAAAGAEYIEGRFRLGLGFFFSYANIDRVTLSDDDFEFTSWGLFGTAAFDVVRFASTGAFFVQAKISGDVFVGGSDQGLATSWGPTFSGGFRY